MFYFSYLHGIIDVYAAAQEERDITVVSIEQRPIEMPSVSASLIALGADRDKYSVITI